LSSVNKSAANAEECNGELAGHVLLPSVLVHVTKWWTVACIVSIKTDASVFTLLAVFASRAIALRQLKNVSISS
jgi:hypothetical protein